MCIHYTISDSLYISFNILPFVSYIFNIHYLSGSFFLSLSIYIYVFLCVCHCISLFLCLFSAFYPFFLFYLSLYIAFVLLAPFVFLRLCFVHCLFPLFPFSVFLLTFILSSFPPSLSHCLSQ